MVGERGVAYLVAKGRGLRQKWAWLKGALINEIVLRGVAKSKEGGA